MNQSTNTRILIIDDDKNSNTIMEKKLSMAGYTVHTCDRGQTGVMQAANKKVSIILLDLVMPGMDGFEVLKKLRVSKQTRDIPVLIISGRHSRSDIQDSVDLGAAGYIRKPIDYAALQEKIELLLNNPQRPSGLTLP